MSETKKPESKPENKTNKQPKNEIAIKKKTPPARTKKKPAAVAKSKGIDLEQAFDEAFDRFRSDFEDLLFPLSESIIDFPDTRVPMIDLENREKDFLLKAEMPGFKKEDIEINVLDDAVEITGLSGWKYEEKEQSYICKERACKSFYRYVDLPEEVKADDVDANLNEGVLEITLPKKTPKQKRRVQVK
jgi:HSP20 family protein